MMGEQTGLEKKVVTVRFMDQEYEITGPQVQVITNSADIQMFLMLWGEIVTLREIHKKSYEKNAIRGGGLTYMPRLILIYAQIMEKLIIK
ncbi:MAG: hypothetical protein LBH92_01460 [Bacteroidales bacterium]|jgi:hypothetical protein|nr:hypothetical protein [Bacteroidales bacterium]